MIVEDISLWHGVFKYLHILLFVYWLGGDAGVFYSSKFVTENNKGEWRVELRDKGGKILASSDFSY